MAYRCDYCTALFTNFEGVRQHYQSTGHKVNLPSEYTCEDCSNVYASLAMLSQHCKATGHHDDDVEQM